MIAYIWNDAKRGDWMALIILSLIAMVSVLLLWMCFFIADSSFLSERNTPANVLSKHHSPGHMQTSIISTGKITTIQNFWVPDSWSVQVFALTESVSCPVSRSQFNSVSNGDEVTAKLVTGRFSMGTYCNGVESIK